MIPASKHFTYLLLAIVLLGSCRKKLSPETIKANATIETELPVLQSHVKKIGNMIGGYYSGTPSLYPKTSKNYPLLLSIHGIQINIILVFVGIAECD